MVRARGKVLRHQLQWQNDCELQTASKRNTEIMYEKILSVELKTEFFSVIFLKKTLFNSSLLVR